MTGWSHPIFSIRRLRLFTTKLPVIRQWPKVSDFVARFCTLLQSKNIRTCENRTRFKNTRTCENSTREGIARETRAILAPCFDWRIVQNKCGTKSYTSGHCLPVIGIAPAASSGLGRPNESRSRDHKTGVMNRILASESYCYSDSDWAGTSSPSLNLNQEPESSTGPEQQGRTAIHRRRPPRGRL